MFETALYKGIWDQTLASFPGLPTVHFLSLAVYKNGGGRPGPVYHVNDVSVYLGRQKGGDS